MDPFECSALRARKRCRTSRRWGPWLQASTFPFMRPKHAALVDARHGCGLPVPSRYPGVSRLDCGTTSQERQEVILGGDAADPRAAVTLWVIW